MNTKRKSGGAYRGVLLAAGFLLLTDGFTFGYSLGYEKVSAD